MWIIFVYDKLGLGYGTWMVLVFVLLKYRLMQYNNPYYNYISKVSLLLLFLYDYNIMDI